MNILTFIALSMVIHVAVLAPWAAPIVPTYRTDAVLSVGLINLDRASVSTDVRATAASQESQLAGTNANHQKPHARDNKRDGNFDTPTKIRAVAKLRVNNTPRKPEGIPKDPNIAKTAAPIPFPKHPNAAPFTGMQRQQRPHDKLIALSSAVRFEPPVTITSTTAHGEAKLASAHIRGKLQTDFARYFSYPAIARQRGWQGHVQVGFRVQPDGKLTNIYIARSSGYRLLDKSALKALRQVEPLAEAVTLLKGKSVDMELPVIYKLERP